MRLEMVRRLLVVGAILTFPAIGHAQDANLSGTVTDTSGAVVPGVTVTAVNEASGNTFEAVTDERGKYQTPVRTGVYRITAPGAAGGAAGGGESRVGPVDLARIG